MTIALLDAALRPGGSCGTIRPTKEAQLFIDQFQRGQAAGSLRIKREDGMSVASDPNGQALFTAQSLANGSVLVRNGSGKQMASYSADQIERILGSSRR